MEDFEVAFVTPRIDILHLPSFSFLILLILSILSILSFLLLRPKTHGTEEERDRMNRIVRMKRDGRL